jgi:WD40 repeat protein
MRVPSARSRPRPTINRVIVGLASVLASGLLSIGSDAQEPRPRTWTLSDAHTNSVSGLAFSPDGRALASSSRDGTVKLWDLTTGRVRATLEAHPRGWVNAVAFSPDGRTIATGSGGYSVSPGGELDRDRTGGVKLWDVGTGRLRATLDVPSGIVGTLTFSQDGLTLASTEGENEIGLWEMPSGRLRSRAGLSRDGAAAAFSPDLKTVALVGRENTVSLVDVATGQERVSLRGHRSDVYSLAFSPDGKTLASGAGEPSQGFGGGPRRNFPGEVKLWDLTGDTPRERASLEGLTLEIRAVAFSPDNRLLAAGGFGQDVKVWDAGSGALVADLEASCSMSISTIAFSPDGTSLAVGGLYPSISVWDTGTWRVRSELVGRIAHRIAYSPDGTTLAVGLSDGTVVLRDVASGRVRAVLQGHRAPVKSLAYSRDGGFLASGGGDGKIHLWDPETGRRRGLIRSEHSGDVTSLAFSPDGKALASGGKDATVRLWDVATGRHAADLKGHQSEVPGVAFSPDGATLASAGHEGTIRLWDVAGRREKAVLRGHTYKVNKTREETRVIDGQTITSYAAIPGEFQDLPVPICSLAYSPDGKTLATGDRAMFGNAAVSLWDAVTGDERLTFTPSSGGSNPMGDDVNGLSFSADGKRLAVAGYNTVRITDAATGKVVAALKTGGHSPIRDLAFSPDGKTLTCSCDQVVLSWDVGAALK